VISIRNLKLSYEEKAVFDDFSADLPASGVTVLRGVSGAGKTTLFRLLLGLEKPGAGAITGVSFQKPAVVFQEDRLLPWASALENAALGSDEKRAAKALEKLGLEESMALLPRELSGGMRRRVAIARALAYEGDTLFLDEPFTGLDERNKKKAVEAIREAGVPVFVITHEDSGADLFGEYRTVEIG
jgi:ABC-type nitrate/sulfonate/bicarbonate transport system ATPase subunit